MTQPAKKTSHSADHVPMATEKLGLPLKAGKKTKAKPKRK